MAWYLKHREKFTFTLMFNINKWNDDSFGYVHKVRINYKYTMFILK